MQKFILLYPAPAALRIVAEKAAEESRKVIQPAQIHKYIDHLIGNAFRVRGFIGLQIECEVPPNSYTHVASAVFVVDDKGNAKSYKGKRVSILEQGAVYEAIKNNPPTITLTMAKPENENDPA
ncbi:hypothetical protein LU11_gp338 [Pseudomonas phage Lu11]|uniref:hypothetical protein n=1 Tax=Pseudomonas phage Lu11 TaxID=1161927 RepID=UPI00025F187C|nr:hypothetical protein LU11_gp338 [Pseudomonas phage Lu11]AFH14869.1 hypothetical protein Lu11_0331 [Pseudomonas phage Lu11]